jgi:integrase
MTKVMTQKFRLYRRGNGRFYLEDNTTGKQESLHTSDKAQAHRLLAARNEAEQQPAFNALIARTYLASADPAMAQRTWKEAMAAMISARADQRPSTRQRYEEAFREPVLARFGSRRLLETRAADILQLLKAGTTSTNLYFRRLHNFAHTLGWLPWPILNARQWPAVQHKQKRGITWEEHRLLVDTEKNAECQAFLELAWHVGAAQIDLVSLTAENIDWKTRTISYTRCKTGQPCLLRFGADVVTILKRLPASGPLFPKYSKLCSADRATRFAKRCRRLGITKRCEEAGIPTISLHSYRYAWAERALAAGYPERFAQEALGHASAAVHRAYARSVRVELPPLEEYEREAKKIVPLPRAA